VGKGGILKKENSERLENPVIKYFFVLNTFG
jgi:hypothetical protein